MPTKMAEKNAGSTTCGNEELVFLANAIKEGRKRRLKMQLALNIIIGTKSKQNTVELVLSDTALSGHLVLSGRLSKFGICI